MAFTVIADHARQEQVWDGVSSSRLRGALSDPPHAHGEHGARLRQARPVRRRSTPTSRRAASCCAICSSTTMAAGLQDVPLLDRLVAEKLKAEAETIAAEGWKWIEVAVDFPYGHDQRPARARRRARRSDRRGAGDARCAATPSTPSSKPSTRTPTNCPMRSISASARSRRRCAAFEDRPLRYDPAEIARAGVFVSIDADGSSADRSRLCPAGGRSAGCGRPTRSRGRRLTADARRSDPRSRRPARRHHHRRRGAEPSRTTRTTPSSRCPIGWSPS